MRTTRLDTKFYVVLSLVVCSAVASAQQYPPPAPYPPQQYPAQSYPGYNGPAPQFYPDQLDNLVGRIALYPDPLLAEILTASTYPDQIPQAAAWASEHRSLAGPDLTAAMQADQLYFEPNVMALIPFPDVLAMMARDPGWTQELGSAVLSNRGAVMDAVQRMRQQAYDDGYLRSNPYEQVVVQGPGMIKILPAQPGYYYVPRYNPAVVFGLARPDSNHRPQVVGTELGQPGSLCASVRVPAGILPARILRALDMSGTAAMPTATATTATATEFGES